MSSEAVGATRRDYREEYETFRLEDAQARLAGDPASAINACVECCDRYVGEGRVALRCLSADETLTSYTFEDLQALSARAANVFRAEGVEPGTSLPGSCRARWSSWWRSWAPGVWEPSISRSSPPSAPRRSSIVCGSAARSWW